MKNKVKNTEKNTDAQFVDVVALALQRTSDLRYLVTRRGPGQSGAEEWEFPGGKIEPGETQEMALAREIEEELGLRLNMNDLRVLRFLGQHTEHYPQKSVRLFLWTLQLTHVAHLVLSEHDLALWLTPDEMRHFSFSRGDQPFLKLL